MQRRFGVFVFAVIAVFAVPVLVGCTSAAPTSGVAVHTSSPAASASSSPVASGAATQPVSPVTLPADCRALIGAASTSFFATFPLNDPSLTSAPVSGVVAPTQPKSGASPEDVVHAAAERYCLWRDPQADITGLALTVARADATVSAAVLTKLASSGYVCTDAHQGRQCQDLSKDPQYGVQLADTVFVRDGIVIEVSQANVATRDLIGSVVATVWT